MGDGMGSDGPLSSAGVNFSDPDQASDFLGALLDDTELQIIGNSYARYFWYGVVVVVGLASIFHWARWLVLQMRLRAAARKQSQPARPKNVVARWFATFTAMGREVAYPQHPPLASAPFVRFPPLGTILLILTYLAFVLALEFVNDSVTGAQFWQARGVRAGWLAVAQVPLLVLLVGKNNLVTTFTGVSYERLNVLHRWSARVILLLAVFHFAFQSTAWQQFGLMQLEWSTDTCPPTGIAAFAVLLWMNISTAIPLRYWQYEFFVWQHIISFFGFIIAVVYHLPSTAFYSRVYIYIPIGLYCVDRIIRTVHFGLNNAKISRATLTALDGGATKIQLSSAAIKHWQPGQHVLLSIPSLGFGQSHPATIVSTPRSHDGDLVFILKSHKGFTRRIMTVAHESTVELLSETKQIAEDSQTPAPTYAAFLQGPYGGHHSDFAAFDSVCLIAGSTGTTFTLSILQNLAERAASSELRLPVRRVHFIWCVKDSSWTAWVNREIATAKGKLESAGIEATVSIYVTCASAFTDEQGTTVTECGCECDKSLGPCCCTIVDEQDEKTDDIAPIGKVAAAAEKSMSSSAASASSAGGSGGARLSILPCATFHSGRPAIAEILTDLLDNADGESGVAVCGPVGLTSTVRNTVTKLSDQRAIHKGTAAQGCYLHVESAS